MIEGVTKCRICGTEPDRPSECHVRFSERILPKSGDGPGRRHCFAEFQFLLCQTCLNTFLQGIVNPPKGDAAT